MLRYQLLSYHHHHHQRNNRRPRKQVLKLHALFKNDTPIEEIGAATEADLRRDDSTASVSEDYLREVKQTVARNYDPGESYYVWHEVHVAVPAVLFVIDTGAMVSMLTKQVYDEIPEADKSLIW